MTRTEHLLTILAEECAEVAQRVSKALRFGLAEVQPGQPHTNAERINAEVSDLMAVLEMLHDAGALPVLSPSMAVYKLAALSKKVKVEKFLEFSAGRGLVDDVPGDPATPHPEARPS
jgi:hypothetical protein